MQKITKVCLTLLLSFGFNLILFAQPAEIYCPSDVCGSDASFGVTDGVYTPTGSMSNGYPTYTGPNSTSNYTLALEDDFLAPGLTVFFWRIRDDSGDIVYTSDDTRLNATFSVFEESGNWVAALPDYEPVPESAGVLPVELIDFTAESNKDVVQLSWQTANERNNEGFEVERSSNGSDWEYLDFVVGAGDAEDVRRYNYTDEEAMNGINYYRLKQIDFDGQFTYSPVAKADIFGDRFKISPNPVSGGVAEVQFDGQQGDEVEIIIFDIQGRVVLRNTVASGDGNQLSLQDLTAGMYIVSAQIGTHTERQKLIIR